MGFGVGGGSALVLNGEWQKYREVVALALASQYSCNEFILLVVDIYTRS